MKSFLGIFLLFVAGLSNGTATVSFNRDIRPILSDNCFACHGPDEKTREADLRLDLPLDKNSPIITAGKPGESELFKRITTRDEDDVMPPLNSGKTLSVRQIDQIKEWIKEGANYEAHWAFLPLSRPTPPSRYANPIDAFVSKKLSGHDLAFSPAADKRTLIRRLYLDLTGLPPEPEEVRQFTRSRDPRAWERMVDLILASPHYGERMAIHWLDLARYADTIGYHGDVPVSVWPYRDYVINAFNSNMPFDQFTREQLAGDLLPGSTDQQKIASTFNRLNRMSTEGGIQDKEYLAKYAADRVRTVSTIWMGATLACAECHDHKFDPLLTKDFYSMEAFFADLNEKGFYDKGFSENSWGPKLMLPTADQKKQLARFDKAIAELKSEINSIKLEEITNSFLQWETTVLAADKAGILEWKTQNPIKTVTENGAMLEIATNNNITATGPNPDNETYIVTFKPGAGTWRALRLETGKDEMFAGNRVARAGISFIVTGAELWHGETRVPIRHVVASSEGEGFPALGMLDISSETGWGISPGHSREHQAVFYFTTPLTVDSNSTLTLKLKQNHYERKATIGRFNIALSSFERPGLEIAGLPDGVLKAFRTEPGKRDEKQLKTLFDYHKKNSPRLEFLNQRLATLQASRSMVLHEVASTLISEPREKPRTIRVLPRGDWMNDSGEIVQPQFPSFFQASYKSTNRLTRLDLANWFVSDSNPLAARAFVNRLWKIYFGTGLSKTLDDLGAQGEWPSHPELLEWLACEFRDSGWDIKHIVKTIVTSQTYQQSSKPSEHLLQIDPQNRLLARQSRLQLEAELVRDNALAISGLLVRDIGGPSVRPYQPAGYYASLNFPKREYVHDRGDKLYRRAIYTHWQRTFPHPSLLAFDIPGREECTAIRVTSNTPLQALVLLNDPIYVEAARVLGQKLAAMRGRFGHKLNHAFELALSRPASTEESALLEGLYTREKARFAESEESAQDLLATGDAPSYGKASLAEQAAWTSVARAILNMNQTITRN